MPGPPAPFVPTPLPNVGRSGESPKGYSTTVKIESKAVALRGASFGSQGDIASKGTGGGIVSANAHGPTKFLAPGSRDVRIEGKSVQYLGDQMMNNCGPSGSPANAATMMGVLQAADAPAGPDPREQKCKESRADILRKAKLLHKEILKYDPVKDARGGFPMRGGKLTKPGGHYNEMKDLQRGLKKDLKKFSGECAGSGVQIDKSVDRMANKVIVKPPGL